MDTSVNKSQWFLWTALAVVLLGVSGFALNRWLRSKELTKPTTTMADYGVAPAFALTDENDHPYSSANLKGRIWLADLIFTHCAGSCPLLTARLASVEKSLVKAQNVQLISFTVDPDHDTPRALLAYAKNYGVDTSQWAFLTGPRASIFKIARDGFHLAVDSVGGDSTSPIIHSERIVLIDAKGHIRGYFDGGDEEIQPKLLLAIGDLMREEKES
jgi:protein SCO1/2